MILACCPKRRDGKSNDLQVRGVFGDVRRYAGQFEVGAVDHGALAAAFLRTHQVLEALAVQAAAVVFLACSGKRGGVGGRGVVMGWERHSRKNGMMEGKEKKRKSR